MIVTVHEWYDPKQNVFTLSLGTQRGRGENQTKAGLQMGQNEKISWAEKATG